MTETGSESPLSKEAKSRLKVVASIVVFILPWPLFLDSPPGRLAVTWLAVRIVRLCRA